MKNYFHNMAKYTALILVSSLPFSVDAFAEYEKKPSSVAALSLADKKSTENKRKVLANHAGQEANEV